MTKNFKAISLFMLILIAVGIICSCGGNGVDTDLGVNSDTTSQDTVIDSNPNKPVTSDTETEISSDLITDTSTDTNTDINADSDEIIDTESAITAEIDREFISFEFKLVNIETDAQKNAQISFGAYTIDKNGKIAYIQPGTPNEGDKFAYITYNTIANA